MGCSSPGWPTSLPNSLTSSPLWETHTGLWLKEVPLADWAVPTAIQPRESQQPTDTTHSIEGCVFDPCAPSPHYLCVYF